MLKCSRCGQEIKNEVEARNNQILSAIRETDFNRFTGTQIYDTLIKHKNLWTRLEVPKDYNLDFDGTDTIHIYPDKEPNMTHLLGMALRPDECDWRTDKKGEKYVRVWWD